VVIASQDGKIVCDNTLDARVEISFKQKLPEVYMSYLIHQCMVIQWI
jgi:vacuolar-type H+-ATPase subunit E/Vma4